MATTVKISGSTYTYTISNLQNALTVTPSNRYSRYGAVYAKPTIKRNKSGEAFRRYFYVKFLLPTDDSSAWVFHDVEYRAIFTKNGTTATVDEVNASEIDHEMGAFAYYLSSSAKKPTYTGTMRVYASTGDVTDYWTYASASYTVTAGSGWTPTIQGINYHLVADSGAPDSNIFGYISGFCSVGFHTQGNSGSWDYWQTIYGNGTLTLTGAGQSVSKSGQYGIYVYLPELLQPYIPVNTTSITATAKITNALGGSASATPVTVNVQPYSKPTINTLSISRTSATRSADSAVISVGWIIDALNKQSTVTPDIKAGAVTASWVSVDLQDPNTEYASGSFDIISDGDSVTTLADQADEIAQDADRTRAHDTYDSNHTYRFTVTLTDRLGQSSEPIPAILNSKFFLISAKAGGKGIGFGMAPLNEGFHVNMPATFYDDVDAEISELSGAYSGGLNDKAVMTDDTALDWHTILNTQTADRGLIDQILAKFADDHKYDCDWTDLPMSSTAKVYSPDQKPMYKRYGHVVQVYGAVAPKAQVAAGGSLNFATLPQHYRPPRSSLMILCQGSANNKWVLYMGYDGLMSAQRYSTGGTSAAMPTSVWLPFSVTFLV